MTCQSRALTVFHSSNTPPSVQSGLPYTHYINQLSLDSFSDFAPPASQIERYALHCMRFREGAFCVASSDAVVYWSANLQSADQNHAYGGKSHLLNSTLSTDDLSIMSSLMNELADAPWLSEWEDRVLRDDKGQRIRKRTNDNGRLDGEIENGNAARRNGHDNSKSFKPHRSCKSRNLKLKSRSRFENNGSSDDELRTSDIVELTKCNNVKVSENSFPRRRK